MCGVVVKGSCRKFVEFQAKFLFGICLFLGKMRMKAFEAIRLFSQGKDKWKKKEEKRQYYYFKRCLFSCPFYTYG